MVGVLEGALRMGLHSFGIGILWSLTRIRECYCTIDVSYAMLCNGEAYLISACLFFVLSWMLSHFEKRKTNSLRSTRFIILVRLLDASALIFPSTRH